MWYVAFSLGRIIRLCQANSLNLWVFFKSFLARTRNSNNMLPTAGVPQWYKLAIVLDNEKSN